MDEKETTYCLDIKGKVTFRVALESPDLFKIIRHSILDDLGRFGGLPGTATVVVNAYVEK